MAFGVGALDAYLCDAFTDTLARCLKNCRQTGHVPPTGYARLELPIGPLLTDYAVRHNWGLRMAARALMEKDNLLRLSRLKSLLNPALPAGHKLWDDLAQDFVDLDRKRLAGMRKSSYARSQAERKPRVRGRFRPTCSRMGEIVQRRHDVVHNCDRPRTAKQRTSLPKAKKMLVDIEDFATILDDHLDAHRLY